MEQVHSGICELGQLACSYSLDVLSVAELIESKGLGVFDVLDEESRLPKATPQHFTAEIHKKNKAHYRLAVSTMQLEPCLNIKTVFPELGIHISII